MRFSFFLILSMLSLTSFGQEGGSEQACHNGFKDGGNPPVLKGVVVMTSPKGLRIVLVPKEANKFSNANYGYLSARPHIIAPLITHIRGFRRARAVCTWLARIGKVCVAGSVASTYMLLTSPSITADSTGETGRLLASIAVSYAALAIATHVVSPGNLPGLEFSKYFRELTVQDYTTRVEDPDTDPYGLLDGAPWQAIDYRTSSPIIVALPKPEFHPFIKFLTELGWEETAARSFRLSADDERNAKALMQADGSTQHDALNLLFQHFVDPDPMDLLE